MKSEMLGSENQRDELETVLMLKILIKLQETYVFQLQQQ